MNFGLLDRICDWASSESFQRLPATQSRFETPFSAWVYELGRREGVRLRVHEKRAS